MNQMDKHSALGELTFQWGERVKSKRESMLNESKCYGRKIKQRKGTGHARMGRN